MQIKNSNLSRFKTKKILKCFSIDLTASQTAKLLGISKKTINRFYLKDEEKSNLCSVSIRESEKFIPKLSQIVQEKCYKILLQVLWI
jgi:hypothetical protein